MTTFLRLRISYSVLVSSVSLWEVLIVYIILPIKWEHKAGIYFQLVMGLSGHTNLESQRYLGRSFSKASAVVGSGRQNRLTFFFHLTVACLRPGSCQTPGLKGSSSLILPSSCDFKNNAADPPFCHARNSLPSLPFFSSACPLFFYIWLAQNLLCGPGSPQIQRSTCLCLCLPRSGTNGVDH